MIRLLRGRVALRLLDPPQGLVVLPDQHRQYRRDAEHKQGILARSSHSARVLAVGPPARTKRGTEIAHGFGPGDEVVFVYNHNEKAWEDQVWEDGGPVEYCTQEEVIGVIDES